MLESERAQAVPVEVAVLTGGSLLSHLGVPGPRRV